jgi:hypothetical protein
MNDSTATDLFKPLRQATTPAPGLELSVARTLAGGLFLQRLRDGVGHRSRVDVAARFS